MKKLTKKKYNKILKTIQTYIVSKQPYDLPEVVKEIYMYFIYIFILVFYYYICMCVCSFNINDCDLVTVYNTNYVEF
jgi:hypothetical protein